MFNYKNDEEWFTIELLFKHGKIFGVEYRNLTLIGFDIMYWDEGSLISFTFFNTLRLYIHLDLSEFKFCFDIAHSVIRLGFFEFEFDIWFFDKLLYNLFKNYGYKEVYYKRKSYEICL